MRTRYRYHDGVVPVLVIGLLVTSTAASGTDIRRHDVTAPIRGTFSVRPSRSAPGCSDRSRGRTLRVVKRSE